jgi:RND family efflux transporter MFP subunit
MVAAGLGALMAAGVSCAPADQSDDIEFRVPVRVQRVAAADVEDQIVVTGMLRAVERASLTVETSGILTLARGPDGRRLREGDRVAAGQVIAEITGEDARLAARTEATRQRFLSAKADLESARSLFAQGLITEKDLRSYETALEEARVEYDRSRLTETRNRLVTPIDGVLLRLARDASGQPVADGQLVAPGFEVAQVAPLSPLVAEVDLVGGDVARVTEGVPARVRQMAFAERVFAGEVVRLAPYVDATTRALRAQVEVDNPDELLKPGMFVEVTLVVDRHEDVPVVPREALTERAGSKVVFVLDGQRVRQREVAVGLGDDRVVEIVDGVELGERVVVRGLETLNDSTAVRVAASS